VVVPGSTFQPLERDTHTLGAEMDAPVPHTQADEEVLPEEHKHHILQHQTQQASDTYKVVAMFGMERMATGLQSEDDELPRILTRTSGL